MSKTEFLPESFLPREHVCGSREKEQYEQGVGQECAGLTSQVTEAQTHRTGMGIRLGKEDWIRLQNISNARRSMILT